MKSSDDVTQDLQSAGVSRPAERVFALALILAAGVLLALSPWQVQFFDNVRTAAQPALWPLVSLAGIVGFTFFHWFFSARKSHRAPDELASTELWLWFRALEFPLWFLAYVYLVTYAGYLPGTLVFCPLLTWRLGYRYKRTLMMSMVAAVVIVIVFKGFLQVKVPGGVLYETLPPAVRNFMIIYL